MKTMYKICIVFVKISDELENFCFLPTGCMKIKKKNIIDVSTL